MASRFLLLLATVLVPVEALAADGEALRRFGLASCLASAFGDSVAGNDARRAAGAYLERGDASFEAYEAVAALADEALAHADPAKHGAPIATLACIDFYESPRLRALIDRRRGG